MKAGAQTLRRRGRSGTAHGHHRSAQEPADEVRIRAARQDVMERQEQAAVCVPGLTPPRSGWRRVFRASMPRERAAISLTCCPRRSPWCRRASWTGSAGSILSSLDCSVRPRDRTNRRPQSKFNSFNAKSDSPIQNRSNRNVGGWASWVQWQAGVFLALAVHHVSPQYNVYLSVPGHIFGFCDINWELVAILSNSWRERITRLMQHRWHLFQALLLWPGKMCKTDSQKEPPFFSCRNSDSWPNPLYRKNNMSSWGKIKIRIKCSNVVCCKFLCWPRFNQAKFALSLTLKIKVMFLCILFMNISSPKVISVAVLNL